MDEKGSPNVTNVGPTLGSDPDCLEEPPLFPAAQTAEPTPARRWGACVDIQAMVETPCIRLRRHLIWTLDDTYRILLQGVLAMARLKPCELPLIFLMVGPYCGRT